MLSRGETVGAAVMKLAFHEARSIEETAPRLDLAALDAAAEALAEAPRVRIVGTGADRARRGQDALGQKLQRIGRAAISSTDFHLQLQSIALLSPPDVAVAISFIARSAEIRRAVELARANGVTAIAVTNDPDSPLAPAGQRNARHERPGAALPGRCVLQPDGAARSHQRAVRPLRAAPLRGRDRGAAPHPRRRSSRRLTLTRSSGSPSTPGGGRRADPARPVLGPTARGWRGETPPPPARRRTAATAPAP